MPAQHHSRRKPQRPAVPSATDQVRPEKSGVMLQFTAPRHPDLVGGGAVLGSSLLAAGLAGGHIPPTPALVWPLVALNIAGMAYDLGRKALRQAETRTAVRAKERGRTT
ncbi:hypothetical protein [Streptomyces canus]|uniref:hypothetical protein n=1 Tax=Streptomyces canus TaxID=58343 RepID=UPI00371E1343